MCYPSAKCQKALLSPILRQSKEIVEVLLALQDVPLLWSVTPKMAKSPVLDSHPASEEQSKEPAEVWLELLLVDEELKSHSWRLTMPTSNAPPKRESGQELEVLPWTPLSIPMVVVTINILVIPLPCQETHQEVKRLVWLLPAEPDLSEEDVRSSKKRSDQTKPERSQGRRKKQKDINELLAPFIDNPHNSNQNF